MTYILTDSELNTLIGFYGILPDSLSPYKISPEARTEETLSSLQKTGLVDRSDNEFYLSEDGRVLAELLAAPGVFVKFIKKAFRLHCLFSEFLQ